MNSRRSEVALFATLLAASILVYSARWQVFGEPLLRNEMWRFLLGDVAFLFLQVAVVSLVVDRILRSREKRAIRQKLNMVIGAFFSQFGTALLGRTSRMDSALDAVRKDLIPKQEWTAADFAVAKASLRAHRPLVDVATCDLGGLMEAVVCEKQFVLGLLGNQALLEHEEFSELLWAVTHLAEEFEARDSLDDMPLPDQVHLRGDIERVYVLLVHEWLAYAQHLQARYPYLFSLAMRTNPLDPTARAAVTS